MAASAAGLVGMYLNTIHASSMTLLYLTLQATAVARAAAGQLRVAGEGCCQVEVRSGETYSKGGSSAGLRVSLRLSALTLGSVRCAYGGKPGSRASSVAGSVCQLSLGVFSGLWRSTGQLTGPLMNLCVS